MADESFERSDAEWRARLTSLEYDILRRKGTERAFTGEYWDVFTPGVYQCTGCELPLFRGDAKFRSGCGWPSFSSALERGAVIEIPDRSLGMVRTEVVCSRCAGHLGHVFPDGPAPTGLRYCINSASVTLIPDDP